MPSPAASWSGTTNGTPYDAVDLMVYPPTSNGGPFNHTFTGEGYGECEICLTAARACDSPDSCTKSFHAKSGTISSISNPGGPGNFKADLTDIVLVEVEWVGFDTEEVSGGETWCIPSLSIDADLQ